MQPEAYQLNFEYEESHWWFLARREIILSRIQAMIDRGAAPSQPWQILDFGCGTGGLTQALGQFGSVEGVDFSDGALDYCRKRGLETVRRISSASDLNSESYNLIATFDVLEHIEDDASVLGELHRALKPGGLLIATVPALRILWGGEDEVSLHVRRYTRRELTQKAQQAGFEIVQATYFNTLLFPLIFGTRVFNRLFRPGTLAQSDVKPVSPLLNALLFRIFTAERLLLRQVSLPIGASVLLIAKRN
ncbi:MAG: class I SAM-dependent methyltransferase [Candidatus Hinthialibacter antarcticus]|nr:class I SAM-dependent methyltransferase [Candidatus Hinthialibacter antarcticus]